jgi:hypothetical protein
MMNLPTRLAIALFTTFAAMSAAGCADAPAEESADNRSADVNVVDDGSALDEPPVMTEEECKAQGTVVADIGDGKVHEAGYRCENGQEPIASVARGLEGAVCCPN